MGELLEPDRAQRGFDLAMRFTLGQRLQTQRQVDVVEDRGPRHQGRLLEDESGRVRAARGRRSRAPFDVPCGGLNQAGDQA